MCFCDLISLLCSGVPDKLEAEIMEKIHPPHLGLERTLVHGYPYKPTAMAFDPVQRVLAIGNKEGTIKIFGKRGIDLTYQHESRRCVYTFLSFIHVIFQIYLQKRKQMFKFQFSNLFSFLLEKPLTLIHYSLVVAKSRRWCGL